MASSRKTKQYSKRAIRSDKNQKNTARLGARLRTPTDASIEAVYHANDKLGLQDYDSKLTEDDDYLQLTDISVAHQQSSDNMHYINPMNEYSEYEYTEDDYAIEETATSMRVEAATPFALKNTLSGVSELFNMTQPNATALSMVDSLTHPDDDEDDTLINGAHSESHYAPTETTETATYRDGRSRRVSNSGQMIIDYNEDEDVLPAILETIDPQKEHKHRHPQMDHHMDSDILGLDSTMYVTGGSLTHNEFNDALSCSSHSHSEQYRAQPRYSSLGLVQSDSITKDVNAHVYDSAFEMNEDCYDLLSDAVCDLFNKLNTNNTKSISDDIIKISFNLLDINLDENEFNMFIYEITNHKPQKSKQIRLDMMRSFVLNIQNKSYNHKLNHIRSVIIEGLISANTTRSSQSKNSKNSIHKTVNSNASYNNRHSYTNTHTTTVHSRQSRPKLSRHPSHSPPQSAHITPRNDRVSHHPHSSHAHRGHHAHASSVSTLPTIGSPTFPSQATIDHFSDPTLGTLPALPDLPSIKYKSKSTVIHDKAASKSSKSSHQQLLWKPHITDHDENGACQYDLLLCTLKYSLVSTAVDLFNDNKLNIDNDTFYVYVANSSQKQAFQYLFECFFNFMGHYAEFMSLKAFEASLRHCGITFDRDDICIISFGQLAQAFTGKHKKGKLKQRKLFITKKTFVSWMMDAIYSATNIHYANYRIHYHQYFKWIENDLFSLVDHQTFKQRRTRRGHQQKQNKNNSKSKTNHSRRKKIKPKSNREQHQSMKYQNPVVLPYGNDNNHMLRARKNGKKRHKSHQITPM